MTPTPQKELQKNAGEKIRGRRELSKHCSHKWHHLLFCCSEPAAQAPCTAHETSRTNPWAHSPQQGAAVSSTEPEPKSSGPGLPGTSQAGQQLNGICYSMHTTVHCHCAHCNFGHPVTCPEDESWDRTGASSSRACFQSQTGETVIQYCKITGLNPFQVLNNGQKTKIYSAAKLFNSLNQVSCVCVCIKTRKIYITLPASIDIPP